MALINPTSDDAFNDYVVVRANNAAEMQQKLTAAAAALDPITQAIVDFQLAATGAAPNFLAMLTVAELNSASVPEIVTDTARFLVVGGIGGLDPVALTAELAAQVRGVVSPDNLFKMVTVGGGAGPHWMAAAIYTEGPE